MTTNTTTTTITTTASPPSKTTKKDIAIIGLGISGLTSTKTFSQQGHNVIAFEKEPTIGGVWNPKRSYPNLKTQSPKDLYQYTDHPMPTNNSYPEWPSGEQVLEYLESYVEKFHLRNMFRFGVEVEQMVPRKDQKDGWTLSLKKNVVVVVDDDDDDSNADNDVYYSMDFDFVVICTGTFTYPKMISHPGQDAFLHTGGIVIHSSEYKSILEKSNEGGGGETLKGKRVVIIGGSKSATDIAVHCTMQNAANVTVLMRRNVWRIPYFVGGMINFKHLLYIRAQEVQFPSWKVHSSRLLTVMFWLWYPIFWVNFRMLELLLRIQLKLGKYDMLPEGRIDGPSGAACGTPTVTEGFFEAIQKGSIRPINTTVAKYDNDKYLILNNGEKVEADIVIQATGWTMGLSFLPKGLKQDLIEESDGLFRLYRFAVNPKLPNMGFVGFNSSFCTVLSSEMIANWLVRYVDGMLVNQPSASDMEMNIDQMLDWKRNMYPAAKVYGGNCVAPFHHLHFEEILNDIGATKRCNSWFTYPKAERYGECLHSAPAYAVTPSEKKTQ